MKNLILEGFETDDIAQALNNPHVVKLVREVSYKYGFVAYAASKKDDSNLLGGAHVHLGTKAGLPVCTVFAKTKKDCNDEVSVEYCYKAPWKEKQRGSSSDDRQTYRSSKLNILMATLQKNKVVPSEEQVLEHLLEPVKSVIYNQVARSFGDMDKRGMNASIGHVLLKRMFNEADDSIYGTLDLAECKALLDKWNAVDKAMQERDETIKQMLGEPFYAIGVNNGKHYIIGKARIVDGKDANGWERRKVEVVAPFKRIKALYDVEELRGILTMLKVNHDKMAQDGMRMLGGDFVVPVLDGYDSNLGVAYGYNTLNRYDRQWMVIPCSAL